MLYNKLKNFLNKEKIEFEHNVKLIKYNTMRINSIAKIFIKVKSTDILVKILNFLNTNNINYYLLGNGSNTLFVDKFIKQPIIKLDFDDDIFIKNDFMLLNANISNKKLANYLKDHRYSNFEFLSVIPGCVGAGIAMNASFYNDAFSDNLMYVEIVDKKGSVKWISKNEIEFEYRSSSILKKNLIITRAIFRLKKEAIENIENKIKLLNNIKNERQPIDKPSCGSIFKNDEKRAYEYLNDVGMKGFYKGGAKVSSKHSNFIINFNNASGKDVLFIIEKAHKKVYDKYKVNLILEIRLVRSSFKCPTKELIKH